MLGALVARRWTIVIALAALAIHFMPVNFPGLALSREALAHGRAWTLLTGAVVHVSAVHVWMDVLGLLLVGIIFEPRFGRAWPWLIAFINIVVGLGVLAVYPHLPGYCGLSALDQGLLAAGCVGLLFEKHHAAAALIGGVLIAKWTFEIAGGLPLMGTVSDDASLYGQPVPWAHAIGGITGAAAAIGLHTVAALRLGASTSIPGTRCVGVAFQDAADNLESAEIGHSWRGMC